jgi:transposase
MTISELALKSSDLEPVRRFEVFTGSGRRREWSPENKARIVAESYVPEDTVCAVARRYALSPQQLFAWRRAARQPAAERAPMWWRLLCRNRRRSGRHNANGKPAREAGVIELEIDGVAMRVGRGADSKAVAAVIRALKATT